MSTRREDLVCELLTVASKLASETNLVSTHHLHHRASQLKAAIDRLDGETPMFATVDPTTGGLLH